jgi:hypothetical protein
MIEREDSSILLIKPMEILYTKLNLISPKTTKYSRFIVEAADLQEKANRITCIYNFPIPADANVALSISNYYAKEDAYHILKEYLEI